MRCKALFALLVLLLPAGLPAAFWMPATNGLQAYSFNDILINPANPQVVYVCGLDGIFKSTNGGASWNAANTGLAPSPYTLDIEMEPGHPDTLYAVSQFSEGGRGVYKTTNGGASWSRKSSGIYLPYINSVSIFAGNPSLVFAGTNVGGARGGVFFSDNGGDSWTLIAGDDLPGSGIGNDAAPIVVDPGDSSIVFCGRNSYTGFLRSVDGGHHWTWSDNSFIVRKILIDSADANRILAGGTGFLKISRNRGASLTDTGVHFTIGGLAQDPSNAAVMYAGAVGAPIYRSADHGDSWAPVGNEAHNWSALAVQPGNPNVLFAATMGEGVLQSLDGGLHWTARNSGLPTQMRCTRMASSQRYKTVWAILDNRALYASYDDGNAWHQLMGISGYPGDLEVWPGDGKTLYLANGDIYRSSDLGFNWLPLGAAADGHTLTQVAVNPSDSDIILIGDDTARAVKRSTDGGQTWQIVLSVPPAPVWGSNNIFDIDFDPSDPQRIYAATYNNIWRTQDGGDHWTQLTGIDYLVNYSGNLRHTAFIRDIHVDSANPSIVYAATQWGGSWKSKNYGDSWTRLNIPWDDQFIHNNILLDPRDHNVVYIPTFGHGLAKSTDGGATWAKLADGLGTDTTIHRIAISPWDMDHIFAGSLFNGVWRGGGSAYIPTLHDAVGLIPDGGVFAFSEPQIVSASFSDGAIIAQAEDRSAGARVLGADGLQPGDRVAIRGVLGTQSGERTITALAADRLSTGEKPRPLVLTNEAVGGASPGPEWHGISGAAGLANTGLLVTTSGRVTALAGPKTFYMDDGSRLVDWSYNVGIRVQSDSASLPAVGDYVRVTGASGALSSGPNTARLLRVPSPEGIVPRNFLSNTSFETGDASDWTGESGTVQGSWFAGIHPRSGSKFWGHATDGEGSSAVIYQQVAAPEGSGLQARVYSLLYRDLNSADDARSRIGIDPTGGADPDSPSVVWSPWDIQPNERQKQWSLLNTPTVVAGGDTVTVFLQAYQSTSGGWHINCFDDAALLVAD